MLSRLKRRAPSASLADSPFDDAPSPPTSDTASHDDSTLSSPSPVGKNGQRSFTTPVKSPTERDSGRTLSPARAYGTGAVAVGRASRSSSFGSYQGERRTINLSPGDLGNSGGRVDDIGHGSLTLDHLAPPDGSSAPLTLLVQAPELLVRAEKPADGDAHAAAGEGSDQRSSLAASGLQPAQAGVTAAPGSVLVPVVPNTRHRSHTTSEAPPPGYSARANGLDALARINNSTLSPPPESPTKQLRASSPPSSSRPQSRATSRPLSRTPSVNSQQQPENLSARTPPSVSPTRGRRSTTSKDGIAGAIALSGVALASPSQSLRQPHALAPLVAAGNGAISPTVTSSSSPSDEKQDGAGRDSTDSAAPGRESLDQHISPTTSVIDHNEALLGVPLATTYSHDQPSMYDGALGVGSTLGDHLSGFLSMDQLGDFDDVVSMLGTGYAVASSKRNADFHALFRHIPEDDYLIEDYGCALQREILIQGRLYISEHHLSFYANIFGWVTSLTIPFSEVCSIEKRMTAYVIPNAIQIATMHARHTFASFLSRDTTYDLIGNIWRMFHPVVPMSAALPDTLSTSANPPAAGESEDEDGAAAQDAQTSPAVEGKKERAKKRLKGFRRPRGGTGESTGSTSKSVDFALPAEDGSAAANGGEGEAGEKKKKGKKKGAAQAHPPTVDTCPTLKNLKEVCMDTTFPGAPEKIYNLMFTSGFMKDFWAENQKLTEIQIGDWAPQASGSNLLARSMSYIKPLNGSIGPKSTKCLITDESAHVDFDDYVCVVTTTRTPDVPSGSAFAVKTRTSMTWAKSNHCRVVVTTGVEWSKSSFIKGIIEKSAIDGQKQYHADLEKAMRAYIHSHRNEFVEEGQDADGASSADEDERSSVDGSVWGSDVAAQAQADEAAATRARGAGGGGVLATVWCTLEPLVEALANQSAASLALGAVVVVLVLSNLWTLRSAGGARDGDLHPAERVRRRNAAGAAEGPGVASGAGPGAGGDRTPQEVAMAVRDVLQDYFAVQHGIGLPAKERQSAAKVSSDMTMEAAEEEVRDIELVLDRLEERIGRLRKGLREAAGVTTAVPTTRDAQENESEALGGLD